MVARDIAHAKLKERLDEGKEGVPLPHVSAGVAEVADKECERRRRVMTLALLSSHHATHRLEWLVVELIQGKVGCVVGAIIRSDAHVACEQYVCRSRGGR